MAKSQLFSGARGSIALTTSGGVLKTIAFTTDISVNVKHNVKQTYTIGDMNASAIDSLAYDVDVSVGRVIPVSASDADSKVQTGPPAPSAPNQVGSITTGQESTISSIAIGFEQVIAAITTSSDLTITVIDRVTGMNIAMILGCRFSGRSVSMNAGDIATERLNFVGIYDAGMMLKNGAAENSATSGYGL